MAEAAMPPENLLSLQRTCMSVSGKWLNTFGNIVLVYVCRYTQTHTVVFCFVTLNKHLVKCYVCNNTLVILK